MAFRLIFHVAIDFQSTAVAFDEVTEHNVYLCTGQPLPTDIAKIVEWMLNENFSTAYESTTIICSSIHWFIFFLSPSADISRLKMLKGLALQDIITQIHTYIHRGT